MKYFLLSLFVSGALGAYEANWTSLDSRPLPPWYDEAKVGIFLHWGVFSVPSFGSEWFWDYWQSQKSQPYIDFMEKNYPPGFTYQDFAPQFRAEFFDPVQWAELFNASGARYVVLTAKHHEGFTNWPSKVSWNWNSMDVGPKRDLVGDLAKAIRGTQPHIHFGLYHSLLEWYNPLYLQDQLHLYSTQNFVDHKTMPELYELVNTYHPEVIWSDGDWSAFDVYWKSREFLAWLFNDSPVKDTVVVNDRWGIGTPCHHGSFYNCKDSYNPGTLQKHKWENAMTVDRKSWGYRRNAKLADIRSIHELLTTMAMTVSCGGNMLLNVGPTKEGMIPTVMEERLRQMGEWLGINGEAIYESKPWGVQNDTLTPGVWYTQRDKFVYAIMLSWPTDDVITLGSVATQEATAMTLLGNSKADLLHFTEGAHGVSVQLPSLSQQSGRWAWVIKMLHVEEKTDKYKMAENRNRTSLETGIDHQ